MLVDTIKGRCGEIFSDFDQDFPFLLETIDNIKKAKVLYIPEPKSFDDAIKSCISNIDALKELSRLPHNPIAIEMIEYGQRGCLFLKEFHMGETGRHLLVYMFNIGMENGRECLYGPTFLVIDIDTIQKNKDGVSIKAGASKFNPPANIESIDLMEDGANKALRILGLIAIINSPKIIDRQEIDNSKINRKRHRSGKDPLTSYSIIHIKKNLRNMSQGDGGAAGVSFHWRRGHFKAKKNGIFWWNPHTVGDKKHGEVISGYLMDDCA